MRKPQITLTASSHSRIDLFCLATAIESALAFLVMLFIPGDPKNSWLFGFSRTRVLLLGLLLFSAAFSGVLSYSLQNFRSKFNQLFRLVKCLLSSSVSVACLGTIPLLGLISSGLINVQLFFKGGFFNSSFLRILPVSILFFLLCLQSLAMLVWAYKSKRDIEKDGCKKFCIDTSQVIFVQVFIILMIAVTGFLVQIFNFCLPQEMIGQFVPRQLLDFFLIKFNIGFKNNIVAFFIALHFFICALISFIFSKYAAQRKSPYVSQWRALMIVFLLLSIDEIAELFDKIFHLVQRVAGIKEITSTGILFPLLILVLLIWFKPLIQNLPVSSFQKKSIVFCAIGVVVSKLVREYLLWQTNGTASLSTELVKIFEVLFLMNIGILFNVSAFKIQFKSTPVNSFQIDNRCISIKTSDNAILRFSLIKIGATILGVLLFIFLLNIFLVVDINFHAILNLRFDKNLLLILSQIFNPNMEVSFPTHFSTVLLVVASTLLQIIGILSSDSFNWKCLSAIFFLLAIDEAASLHEMLGDFIRIPHVAGQYQHYFWFIPLIPILAVLAISYLPFWLRLPTTEKFLFVIAGAIYLFGAVGMEVLGGWFNMTGGANSLVHNLSEVIEEAMEMGGVTIFIFALQHFISNWQMQFDVQLTNQMAAA